MDSATTTKYDLKNKPLVEAILEVKWGLATPKPPMPPMGLIDPHSRLLAGRLSERVRADYPFHEQLPTASMPDEMVPHITQHRFRVAEGGWPLVQVGPGIFTVNDTEGYTWSAFQKCCEKAVGMLLDAYPEPKELKVQNLVLRYIDAVPFDQSKESILGFLKDKLKVDINLPEKLFAENMDRRPTAFNWHVSFPHTRSPGTVVLRFATGNKPDGSPVLLWETIVASQGPEVPEMGEGFSKWLDDAHTTTHNLFFVLIEGELFERFSRD